MSKIKLFYRQGFTLMELLIVLAIVMALFAIVLPTLFKSRTQSFVKQAKIQISQIEGYLELYATENRGYPTTEQGLYALIYFPDNLVSTMTSPTLGTQSPAMTPGMDPNAAFGGNAVAVGGAGTFGNPTGTPMGPMGTPNPMMDPSGMGGMTNPMPGTTGNPAGMTMTNPMDPMNSMGGMTTTNPMDPMGGMSGMTTATTWNQPFHNPQIYLQQRKRPSPYVDSDKSLLDPWGQPYRYDNSMQYYGLNKTGEAKPAIWSAGPDKRDGTEDDILNWDANEAQQRIAQHQQQMQFQGGMGTTNPMDMMGNPMGNQMNNPMGMANPMGMNNPMDATGAGMMNTPMAPNGMPNQPGMMNPMGGTGGMNPMNETGIPQPQPQPMMPNPMPTPTPMPSPTPMPTPTQPM
ncbi:MAG: type II secretion system protein GspG [Planctomycetaceae bacterium]|jgi:prepilin-type N-terminal cleavage/methylation domain-containing protein|nr:type II secretion system protein GspG [Planctomycetaceae bacterium]